MRNENATNSESTWPNKGAGQTRGRINGAKKNYEHMYDLTYSVDDHLQLFLVNCHDFITIAQTRSTARNTFRPVSLLQSR